ncbi:MAG: hypothetical protein PHI97_00620 [Desulfobulbus sp.]|nr:hypothetical protein [Desulfobulbus sp.]
MIRSEEATPYEKCTRPWLFDRIEISGSVFTDSGDPNQNRDSFQRPTVKIRFSLLGVWFCSFQSGPNLQELANYCASISGQRGFYGFSNARRVEG